MSNSFHDRRIALESEHKELLSRNNPPVLPGNGIFTRYQYPVVTAAHTPLFWRYDLNPNRNPFLMERLGVNCCFNPGAIEFDGNICLMVRVEGYDRKSFFAVARSKNGINQFRFDDRPILLPETDNPDTNVYDMRLTRHEDGWIYGIFCTERRAPTADINDTETANVQIGIVRTHDLVQFERLPDLVTCASEQRNVVLHPEFVDGRYALYTRPFGRTPGNRYAPGIGFGLVDSMERAVISEPETITPAQNGSRVDPYRARRSIPRRVRPVCTVCLCYGPRKTVDRHAPPGRLPDGSGRRGTRGRCIQCAVYKRSNLAQQRRNPDLLRLLGYPNPCRYNYGGTTDGLL